MSTSATQQVRFFGRLFIFISILNHENIFDKSCQLPKKSSSDNLSVKYQLLKIVSCLQNENSPLSIFICQCFCSFLAICVFSKNCSPISIISFSPSKVTWYSHQLPICVLGSRSCQQSPLAFGNRQQLPSNHRLWLSPEPLSPLHTKETTTGLIISLPWN